ncbi:MAG TPA: ATP-binding protein [Gemmatimonadales bacterium]|nr:ATP-binding protein [Gemmatimonadales bacterium]
MTADATRRPPGWFDALPIRRKLGWIMLAASAGALLLTALALSLYDATMYRDRIRREADGIATLVASNLTAALSFRNDATAREVLAGLEATNPAVAAAVFDANGREVAQWVRGGGASGKIPAMKRAAAGFVGSHYRSSVPVRLGNEVLGEVQLLYGPQSFATRALVYLPVLAVVIVALLAVSLLLFRGMARTITDPLLNLSDVATRVALEGDRHLRAVRQAPDEIGALTDAFNRMLDSLEDREIALRTSEENLQLAMEAAEIGVWVVELSTGELHWSKQMRHLFGQFFDPQPASLPDVLARIHPDDVGLVSATLSEAVKGGGTDQVEFRFLHPDGRVAWCRAIGRMVADEAGRPHRVIGVGTNTTRQHQIETERAALEQQVIQSQRMESIGTLAGGVAHDFNNLLTAILGNLSIAQDQERGNAALGSLLAEIEDAATRASALTRQLLLFGRRAELRRQPVNMDQQVDVLMRMLRRLIGEHITLAWQPPSQPVSVLADPSQLDQVVMNLAVNARDAMPEGGVLHIQVRQVVLDQDTVLLEPASRTGRFAELLVSDTGTGMSEATRRRIFEPFFTTKGPGQGTGLGLAVVYGIVKQHDGWIQVESEPAMGTTVRVYLPLVDAAPTRREEPAQSQRTGGRETILVAEDEPALRRVVERTLGRLGYHPLVAENGREAVRLFEAEPSRPDLALLDMVMPEMSGREVFERIRRLRPDLPVIFSTGYSEQSVASTLDLGANVRLLPKPYGLSQLTAMIRELLDQTATHNPPVP